jgi:hypothetical protein
MNNPLPAQRLGIVLDILNRWEIVFILLHGCNPRHVVESHDLEAEVLVVADLLDFAEEGGEIGCGDVVDVG